MALSTFALVIAVVELVFGIPMILFPGKTTDRVLELTRNEPLYRTVGAFFLVICVLVLAEGISVGTDTAGLIRLVAWLGAAKSLVICWWPEKHSHLIERVLAQRAAQRLSGVMAVVAGVLFILASTALR